MKQKVVVFNIVFLLFVIQNKSSAQKANLVVPLTADSLASGNYKDIFKSFFQIAFNRITGTTKEIQFTSNPFAVMAKRNPDLLVDTNYYKYRPLRNLNFSFAGKLDSAYRFNGFSSGVKYAIINKRDETVSRAFITSAAHSDDEFNKLTDSLAAFESTLPVSEQTSFTNQIDSLFRGTLTYDKLNKNNQEVVLNYAKSIRAVYILKLLEVDPKLNFHKASKQTYDSLRTLFHNKLLWTAEISDTTYKDQFLFSNIVIGTQVLKGILNPKGAINLQLDIKCYANLLDDSVSSGRDLKRALLYFEPGINLVFKSRNTQQSWAELKVSGIYNHNLAYLYKNEKRDNLIFSGTLRIRIMNDIWIPLEIKYDPKSGNVFGFLNVRANFTGLGTLLKGSGT